MKTCTIIDSIEKMYKPTNYNFADILTSGYFYLETTVLCTGFKRYSNVIAGGNYK